MISTTDINAIPALYGINTKTTRSLFSGFPGEGDHGSLFNVRDKAAHASRRKVWEFALKGSEVNAYRPRIDRVAGMFIKRLKDMAASSPDPINVTRLCNYFAFDSMSEVSFSQDYGLLESMPMETPKVFSEMEIANRVLVDYATCAAWIASGVFAIPGLPNPILTYSRWCGQQMDNKLQVCYTTN